MPLFYHIFKKSTALSLQTAKTVEYLTKMNYNENKSRSGFLVLLNEKNGSVQMMTQPLDNPRYFLNRELSWLEFNQRVLAQALSPDNPVFEQMKFLSITSTNLDEFFMIRVASLRDQVRAKYKRPDAAGLTPKEQLKRIGERAHQMMEELYRIYRENLLPELCRNKIRILHPAELSREQFEEMTRYFEHEVYPVLTPMAADKSRPFPLILNKSLNLGVLLEGSDEEPVFATVQVPSVLPRMVPLQTSGEGRDFVLLEDVIQMHLGRLFEGKQILCAYPYRITRNADLTLEEEEAEDLLQEIKKSLRKRKWGSVIRLEVYHQINEHLLGILQERLEVDDDEIYYINGPLNLDFLMKQLYSIPGFDDLRYTPFVPAVPGAIMEHDSAFECMKQEDILLYHPYESFVPVVRFLEEAASDPNVLAIKQTLYRVSGNSPIVSALARAAEAGKQVTALLEVKARFDEENNIHWGDRLEKAGCHVIYGLAGLKTHSKITLVVRREKDGIHRYVHLGTGNYNDVTAKIYTDYSLFTCDEQIGEDATAFFNTLTGYAVPPEMGKLVAAPMRLREYLARLIEAERQHALRGEHAEIFAKMNSLVDPALIEALYAASNAGVKIRLLVRGICCLIPGIKGVSENIEVHSIVGRFLEHSRIYYFHNGGDTRLFLSSADMMPRNMDRRVELLFPVESASIKERIVKDFELYWEDTAKTLVMGPDGSYTYRNPEPYINAQELLIVDRAEEEAAFEAKSGGAPT